MYLCYAGLLLSILSGDGANGFLSECRGKISVDEFIKCILEKNTTFIKEISLESYKQATHLNLYTSYQMILPKDGTVGVKQSTYKPTLHLNPLFVYVFCLFDKDSLLYVSNPLIVPRSCVTKNKNSSYFGISVKVRMKDKRIF